MRNKNGTIVAAGEFFSLALTADGHIFAWGDNSFGQLALANAEPVTVSTIYPTAIAPILGVRMVDVAARGSHFLAVSEAGEVWGAGRNDVGQVGLDRSTRVVKVPTRVPSLRGRRFLRVSAGNEHSIALTGLLRVCCLFTPPPPAVDGVLYSWGRNTFGQLGRDTLAAGTITTGVHPPTPIGDLLKKRVTDFSAGWDHSLAVANGTAYAWGRNDAGQLGLGDAETRFNPTPLSLPGRAVAVAGGYAHSIFILEDGRVFTAGRNDAGQLGLGDLRDRLSATFVNISAGPHCDTLSAAEVSESFVDEVCVNFGATPFLPMNHVPPPSSPGTTITPPPLLWDHTPPLPSPGTTYTPPPHLSPPT
jgi:alpha-tubulin suppressor-like RCC1 family protein